MVLSSIPSASFQHRVYRMVSQKSAPGFFRSLGFDDEAVLEIRELLHGFGGKGNSLGELCDAPFRLKSTLHKSGYISRFSDGSFPVFYSSLEVETTEAEIRHWFPKFVGKPTRRRTVYYLRFACDFDGITRDLRPKESEWPKLVHNEDYKFCNRVGAEAVKLGLDGLLTPSARRRTGTNLPVFRRASIGNPGEDVVVSATYDPSNTTVSFEGRTPAV